jgi:diguanylate cyclase (GGDEF)-like protein
MATVLELGKWLRGRANGARAHQAEQSVRSESLAPVLDGIVRQEALVETLNRIAGLVEERVSAGRCAVLLLRNGRLRHAAAPHLDEAFVLELEGLPIGPEPGPGAPFWTMAPRASEIALDPPWQPYRLTAEAHGFRSCWSHPVFSGAGEILATVVMYFEERREPTPADWEALRGAALLAAIAIEQCHLVDELAFKTQHDPLTKLSNRELFDNRLQQAMATAAGAGAKVGLINIDLDRFKAVNDLAGQKVGDAVLAAAARRLERCVRHSDSLARTGGDEFTVVLTGLAGADGARAVAQKILESFQGPFLVEGREVFVTASIGVSIYPEDARNLQILEQHAADAMYRVKAEGRNNFLLFQEEMSSSSRERLELEADLRGALERGEFLLHYQPQISIRDGSVAGAEALIRWKHPRLGLVSPAAFIPLAEENGLIVPIGDWVLRQACSQIRQWQDLGAPRFKTAVNVSAVQFARADFVDSVMAAVAAHRLNPRCLELELTESTIMHDVDKAARQMSRLQRLGISIAIDDFGTGYSSLSYLQKLPIDVLKLDQVFVKELSVHGDKRALVQSIVALAGALGKRVIAEGVETPEHLDALIEMDCDLAQGFLLGRPMDPESFLAWLGEHEPQRLETAEEMGVLSA